VFWSIARLRSNDEIIMQLVAVVVALQGERLLIDRVTISALAAFRLVAF
jgi:hypothetical protein